MEGTGARPSSIGEIAVVPAAAAVVSAVNHALGTSMSEPPLTPEEVMAALEGACLLTTPTACLV